MYFLHKVLLFIFYATLILYMITFLLISFEFKFLLSLQTNDVKDLVIRTLQYLFVKLIDDDAIARELYAFAFL